jgi:glycosyltransferase involved in cell wall biosynthesis
MMGDRRLTVAAVVPVYNQRETVCEAIDSVLAQTRPVEEIVVVDDGSTDGSGDLVAERYGSRVRLIRQANGGAAAAFNSGIRATTSDLVSLLGADDKWLPERIKVQAAFMEDHPSCMLSFTGAVLCNEVAGTEETEGLTLDKSTYVRKAFFREEMLPAGNGVLVRREVFDKVGWFDESLRKCQDTDMWLRIMIRYGFEHLPGPLVWVRRGPRRTTPADREKTYHYGRRYYEKHRYTFGRGIRGQATWRSAYGASLRAQACWCLLHNYRRRGLGYLARAIWLWPFFNPTWVLKSAMECVLGPRIYTGAVGVLRRVTGRRRSA